MREKLIIHFCNDWLFKLLVFYRLNKVDGRKMMEMIVLFISQRCGFISI